MPPCLLTLAGFSSSAAPLWKNSISISFKSQSRASRASAARALCSTDDPEETIDRSSPEKPEKPQSIRRKPAGTGFGDVRSSSSKKKSSKTSSSTPSPSSSPAPAPTPATSSGIRRRPAPTSPIVAPQPDPKTQQLETGIEIALLVLVGAVIVEGLALAASGFLPQEWDDFLVKVVYPSFTPTIGLFIAAAAGYGLYKYFGSQNRS